MHTYSVSRHRHSANWLSLARDIVLCGCIGSALPACAASADEAVLDKIRETGTIRVGFRSSAVPFSYVLPDSKKPIGFAIDICERIAAGVQQELKLSRLAVQYVQADGQERFDALKQGRIDMECGNTTSSRERREKLGFAFSIPYHITGTRFLVRTDSSIHNALDLRGRAVAVAKNATGTAQLKKEAQTRSLNLRYEEVETRAQAFELLKQGKVDAFVQDDIVLYNVRAIAPVPSDYHIFGNFLTIEPLAVMFRGEDAGLKRIADRQLRSLMESGEFKAIYRKWFEQPIPPNNARLDMPMNFLMQDLLRMPTDKLTMYPE